MSSEASLREQRQALAEAVNARDLARVESFLHPSFVSRTVGGSVISRDDLLNLYVAPLFRDNREWGEDVEIVDVQMSGDTATMLVRRSHWHSPSRLLFLLSLGMLGTQAGVARSRETWRFEDGRWQLVEQQELDPE